MTSNQAWRHFRQRKKGEPPQPPTGLPVLDSAAIGVWAALHALSVDTRPAAALGRLFG